MWGWRRTDDAELDHARLAVEHARLTVLLEELRMRLTQVETDRDYWKAKTELLLDQTLFRRGEITAPVFGKPNKPQTDHGFANVFGPMAVTEIEGAKRRAPAPGDGRQPDDDAR